MKWMLIILAMFTGSFRSPSPKVMTWAVKESAVNILGSSNVNKFTFTAHEVNGSDTLTVYEQIKGQKLIFEKGLLRLPVKKFRNGNPMLVKDFKKMLDAGNYPYILMNFQSLTTIADEKVITPAQAELQITLAGKTINRQVRVCTSRNGENIFLEGCERLRFSDFALKPPKGVLGFINVKNELDIEFRLVLKIVKEI